MYAWTLKLNWINVKKSNQSNKYWAHSAETLNVTTHFSSFLTFFCFSSCFFYILKLFLSFTNVLNAPLSVSSRVLLTYSSLSRLQNAERTHTNAHRLQYKSVGFRFLVLATHDQIKTKKVKPQWQDTQNHSYTSVGTQRSFGVQHRDWLIGSGALIPNS